MRKIFKNNIELQDLKKMKYIIERNIKKVKDWFNNVLVIKMIIVCEVTRVSYVI